MAIFQQGWSQQTPAIQNLIQRAGSRAGSSTRAARSTRRAKPLKRLKRTASKIRRSSRKLSKALGSRRSKSKAARFVKGSLAAKRHMAKLRKLAKRARK